MPELDRMLRRASEGLLDLVFPPRCIGCGLVGTWICEACRPALPYNRPPHCVRCHRSLPAQAATCADCAAFPSVLVRIWSPFRFEGPIRDALHRLKYRGARALARPLVQLALSDFQRLDWPIELVIPVPLHPRRLRERGHNQAADIASSLAAQLGLPVETGLLRKLRHTQSQVVASTRAARRQNVEGAFGCEALPAKRILLVDDLATTGSTLAAAASALAAAGATEVYGFTLAREC